MHRRGAGAASMCAMLHGAHMHAAIWVTRVGYRLDTPVPTPSSAHRLAVQREEEHVGLGAIFAPIGLGLGIAHRLAVEREEEHVGLGAHLCADELKEAWRVDDRLRTSQRAAPGQAPSAARMFALSNMMQSLRCAAALGPCSYRQDACGLGVGSIGQTSNVLCAGCSE